MSKKEKWICECGLKHNVSKRCFKNKIWKKCPFCNSSPSEEDKKRILKEKCLKTFL